MIHGDASQVIAWSRDLGRVPAKVARGLRPAMTAVGEAFATAWAANAAATSGEHGKHYPGAIDSQIIPGITSVTVEVGPNTAKKQGGMGEGFELGSVNQPPHLDGYRALPGATQSAAKAVDQVVQAAFD